MKFYFCETCGKRLTEHDIEGGVAKNKKLKGVYCTDCADGVMTMDTIPLSDQEAHQVLKDAGQQAPAPDPSRRRGRRRTASNGQPISRTGVGDSTGKKDRLPTRHGSQAAYIWGVVLAAVVLVALGGFLALSGQGNPAEKVKRKGERRSRTSTSKVRSETTPAAEPEIAAEAKGSGGRQEETIARIDPSESPSHAPKNKIEDKADVSPSADARPDPSAIQSESHSAAPEVSPSTPPEGAKEAAPQKAQVDNAEALRKAAFAAEAARAKRMLAMERHVGALADALRSNDFEAADAVALAIGEDKTLDDAAELSTSAAEVVTLLKKIQIDRLKALKDLAGKTKSVILPRATRPQLVEIGELKDDVLTIRISYLINGEKRFRSNTYQLKDLKEVTWKKLAPTPEPADATGWVARAFLLLASKDRTRLDGVLPKCAGHTLHPFLEQALEKLKLGEKEYAAETAWKKAERLMNSKQVERAAEAYLAFLKAYGDTQTRKRHQKELEARLKELESQAKVFLIDTQEKGRKISVWNAPFEIPFRAYYRTEPHKKSVRLALFHHPKTKASLSYALGGAFRTLRFMAGIPHDPDTPVAFSVLGDGKSLWTTSVSKRGFQSHEVNVGGVDLLTLQVTREKNPTKHNGGADWHLHRRLIWLDPYLLRFNLPEQLSALVKQSPPSAAPKVGGLKSGTVACLFGGPKSVEPRPRTHPNEMERHASLNRNGWGYRWRGYLHIPVDGQYTFALDALVEGRFKLGKEWLIGGEPTFVKGGGHSSSLPLKAGVYPIHIEMRRGHLQGFRLNLSWKKEKEEAFTLIPARYFFYDPKELEAGDLNESAKK